MEIFRKRPLFLCCTFYIAASTLAFPLNFTGKIVLSFIILLSVTVALVFALFGKLDKKSVAVFGTAAILAAVAIMASYLFFDYDIEKKRNMCEKPCVVEAVVTDRVSDNASYAVYGIKLTKLDGDKAGFRALLECEGSNDLQLGFKVLFKGIGASLENSRTGYDTKILLADGYKMVFTLDGGEDEELVHEKIEIVDERVSSLSVIAARINNYLCAKLRIKIGDGGALAGALLLGNKNSLPKDVSAAFKRAGVSHVLALSGMHVAMLIGLLDLLLGRLKAKRNFRIILTCVVSVLYLILTGCSISATRAVSMVVIAYFSKFIGRRADTLTSLALIGTVLLMLSPGSVCDISYWLSFLATFGIVAGQEAFSECIRKLSSFANKHKAAKFPIYVATTVGISLCANAAIMLAVWLFFGELAIFSPISTLIISPLAYVLIVLSLCLLILCQVPYISSVIAFLTRACATLMEKIANVFASPDFAVISLKSKYVGAVIIAAMVVTVILLSIKLKRKYLISVPYLVSAAVLCVLVIVSFANTKTKVTYIGSRRSDLIMITSADSSTVCDITNGRMNYYTAIKALKQNGKTFTDNLILTHYHTGHTANVEDFLLTARVKNVYLPLPTSNEEYYEMRALSQLLEKHRVNIFVYNSENDETITLPNDVSLTIRKRNVDDSRGTTVSITIKSADTSLEYIGRSQSCTDIWDSTAERASESDYLIFGSHGPINKNDNSLLINIDVNKTVVFTSPDTVKYFKMSNEDLSEILSKVTFVKDAEWFEFIMEK